MRYWAARRYSLKRVGGGVATTKRGRASPAVVAALLLAVAEGLTGAGLRAVAVLVDASAAALSSGGSSGGRRPNHSSVPTATIDPATRSPFVPILRIITAGTTFTWTRK